MRDYYVTLKINGVVRTVHVISTNIFNAWELAVSVFGGVVCD